MSSLTGLTDARNALVPTTEVVGWDYVVPAGTHGPGRRPDSWTMGNCNFSDYDVNLYSLDTAIAVPSTNTEINAAWSASMTLRDAIAVATLCPSRNTYYEREFTLSGLTGGPLTLCLANSGEIAQIRPSRNNGVPSWLEYVEDKHAQAMQVYNGTYAKLVF